VRNLDFTSWPALLSTLLGLSVITLIGVGIRLLAMQTIQQRRERENRQINERLRTLIAAYKTPVPSELVIPKQGPSRTISAKAGKEGDRSSAKQGGGGLGGGASGAGLGGGYSHDDNEHHD